MLNQVFRTAEVSSITSRLLGALVVTSLLSGCAVLSPPSYSDGYETQYRESSRYESDRFDRTTGSDNRLESEEDVKQRLISETNRWFGTPYKYGGEGRKGIDCSAFVQKLYLNALDSSLPRSTTAQRTTGDRVSRSSLKIGDLVFFKTGPRQKHVGVYVGANEFAHSSSSLGVAISSLTEPYWDRRFEEGIRPDVLRERIPAARQERIAVKPPNRQSEGTTDADLRRGW